MIVNEDHLIECFIALLQEWGAENISITLPACVSPEVLPKDAPMKVSIGSSRYWTISVSLGGATMISRSFRVQPNDSKHPL